MSAKRYEDEFMREAVQQVTERGAAGEVAALLGVSAWSLHRWVKDLGQPAQRRVETLEQGAEIRRLKAELKRVT